VLERLGMHPDDVDHHSLSSSSTCACGTLQEQGWVLYIVTECAETTAPLQMIYAGFGIQWAVDELDFQ